MRGRACCSRALVPSLLSRLVRSWAGLGGFFECLVMANRLLYGLLNPVPCDFC